MFAHAVTRQGIGVLVAAIALVMLAATAAGTGRAHAQVADGGIVIFEECRVVSLQVQASDAKFTSVFWRFGPDSNLGVNSQQVGQTISIGQVPANTELVLGIIVQETGNTFKTGPAARNPVDNRVHAIVDGGTVSFEDKALGEVWADWDYDDAVLSISTQPCPVVSPQVTLTVVVNPASTGSGAVAGGGTFTLGSVAHPTASPAPGSTFGGWSQDCGGSSSNTDVVMNTDKTCLALFLSDAPTVTPTTVPQVAGPPPTVDIANTRTSVSPANVGSTVIFKIDVTLAGVPLTNESEVLITFDDAHLAYVGSLTSECTLVSIGIACDFGPTTSNFSFNLDFTAVAVTASTATNATLGADFDGAGPAGATIAGPASADVAIVDVEGLQLPPLGDGSFGGPAGSRSASILAIALGVIATGAVSGGTFGAVRRRSTER